MIKFIFLLCFGFLFVTLGHANNCPEVKDQIAEKIKANGVKEFSLQDIDKNAPIGADQKVVGVCGGGTKDIIYQKGASESDPNNKNITVYSNNQ